MLVNLPTLIDEAKCYEVIRQLRWPDGVRCPACGAAELIKRGFHTHQAHRQRYQCRACGRLRRTDHPPGAGNDSGLRRPSVSQLSQNGIDIVVRPGNPERFAVLTKLDFACQLDGR